MVPLTRTTAALKIVSKTAAGWRTRTIATGNIGSSPSLRIDQFGKRHLVFVRPSGASAGLYYATDRSGTWTTTRISSAAGIGSPRLVLDSGRHVHVVYARPLAGGGTSVIYATNALGTWRSSTASGPGGGSHPEIALDGTAGAEVGYLRGRDDAASPAWVAHRHGTGWLREEVSDLLLAGRPGVAVDTAGRDHLVALQPYADPIGAGMLVAIDEAAPAP